MHTMEASTPQNHNGTTHLTIGKRKKPANIHKYISWIDIVARQSETDRQIDAFLIPEVILVGCICGGEELNSGDLFVICQSILLPHVQSLNNVNTFLRQ